MKKKRRTLKYKPDQGHARELNRLLKNKTIKSKNHCLTTKIKECHQGNLKCVFLHHFLTDYSSNSIDVNLPTEQDLRNKNFFRFNSINCKDIDK